MAKKVVVGMSGGVDSSVAAYLLKKQGYEVIGVTMLMWDENREMNREQMPQEAQNQGIRDAKAVAEILGIPHYVLDFKEEFQKNVVDYFVEEYLQGRTPNPCNICNRHIKWEALLTRCAEFGAEYVATGHYARIVQLPNGRYTVKNAAAAKKDQTYALCNLTQEQLAHTLMPLGEYEKEEIRKMAEEAGLPVASKKDSQDICFIPDGDYAAFLKREAPERMPGEGHFVNTQGEIIGTHKGIIHYTIGQRKGLNLAMGHPVFVAGIRAKTNEVVIGENEDIHGTIVYCDKINFMGMEDLAEPRKAMVKIRYAHAGSPCLLEKLPDGRVRCTFDEPVRAATPGQSIVFYEDGYVLGSGTIL